MTRHLIMISDADRTCGVEAFARLLAQHLDAPTAVLGEGLPPADDIIFNLPIVAWKRRLFAPIAAAAQARIANRQVTLILHEWADLTLARRISYLPLLALSNRMLFSSPEVMAQFEATPVARIAGRDRGVIPIPPNFVVPEWTQGSALSEALAADRAAGKFVLAQFGSIYPRKDPLVVLDVAAELVRRGLDLRLVFIGSFIGAEVEEMFTDHVAELGLTGRVDVTGYVEAAPELYGLFAEVDAFVYPLAEGLTARRGSVLAAALSGRPVVASAPQRPDAFEHHRLFRALLEAGSIHLVPRNAGIDALADAVLATRNVRPVQLSGALDPDAIWDDVVARIDA